MIMAERDSLVGLASAPANVESSGVTATVGS
jgi:hypothetical protein